MEETTVNNANVFAFGDETVDASADVQGEEAAQTPDTAVNEGVSDPQSGVGKAFMLERKRLESRYAKEYQGKLKSDPNYLIGQRLIQDLMTSNGISAEDAYKLAEDNLVKAIAEREQTSPAVAKLLMENMGKEQGQERAQTEPAGNQEIDIDTKRDQILSDISQMELPKGFDFGEAIKDKGFIADLLKYPTEAAVLLFAERQKTQRAPQLVADQLKARRQIPASSNPQQAAVPEQDFRHMSSEDFRKFKENKNRYR